MWFLVSQYGNYCLIWAEGREDAKRQAHPHLGEDPDHYEVTPITAKADRLKAVVFGSVVINNKYQDI